MQNVCFLFLYRYHLVGFLQPTAGISRVVAPRNGVVRAVYVSDGESLSALMAGNESVNVYCATG